MYNMSYKIDTEYDFEFCRNIYDGYNVHSYDKNLVSYKRGKMNTWKHMLENDKLRDYIINNLLRANIYISRGYQIINYNERINEIDNYCILGSNFERYKICDIPNTEYNRQMYYSRMNTNVNIDICLKDINTNQIYINLGYDSEYRYKTIRLYTEIKYNITTFRLVENPITMDGVPYIDIPFGKYYPTVIKDVPKKIPKIPIFDDDPFYNKYQSLIFKVGGDFVVKGKNS